VRGISAVQDLATFRRFLALLATRHGQILNRSDIAAPLGMSVPSVSRWLDILEATGQVLIVHPWFENAGKRIIKSPKVYIADSGLACHLLGIETVAELQKSPFHGPLFEGLIASELIKQQVNAGERPQLHYFRDQQGLEVDFVVPPSRGHRAVRLIEAKATRTPTPDMATPMRKLAQALTNHSAPRRKIEMLVLYQSPRNPAPSAALAPGVHALDWQQVFTA
jgi:predicted AAA+ superfamily ATPase